jgi:dihydroorotate dehydrogenase (NAD+) catalytic subunit
LGLPGRQDLLIPAGWMPAAGTLGFAPPGEWPLPEAPVAFVTHPVSLHSRVPAHDRRIVNYEGGFLLHTGWPNPGLRQVLKIYRQRWARANVPIWVHLLAETVEQTDRMVRLLEEVEGVMAIELGLAPETSTEEAFRLVEAAHGELPLILGLSLNHSGEAWIEKVCALGVNAVCLTSPYGTLAGKDGQLITGRLYGPGLLPQVLQALQRLKRLGLPLIAGCGIYRHSDIQAAFQAGAAAVQLDSVLWRGWNAQE